MALVGEAGLEGDVRDGPLGVQEQSPRLVDPELAQVVRRRGVEVTAEGAHQAGGLHLDLPGEGLQRPAAGEPRVEALLGPVQPSRSRRFTLSAGGAAHGGQELQREALGEERRVGVRCTELRREARGEAPRPRWCSVAGSESSERYSGASRFRSGSSSTTTTSVSAGKKAFQCLAPAGVMSTVSPRWRVEE